MSHEEEIPDALARDLKALHHTPAVPEAMDARIARMVQQHLSMRRRRLWLAWVSSAAAVAAIVTIGILLIPSRDTKQRVTASSTLSRQVDIVDALHLARRIQSRITVAADDLNHDGSIDQRDVDFIANTAVRLEVR